MPLPSLTAHAAAGYAASHGSSAWSALSGTEQQAIKARHLYGLNYIVSGDGASGADGVIVAVDPGDPLPTQPPT